MILPHQIVANAVNQVPRFDGLSIKSARRGSAVFKCPRCNAVLWAVDLKANDWYDRIFPERIGDGEGVLVEWSGNKPLEGSILVRYDYPVGIHAEEV